MNDTPQLPNVARAVRLLHGSLVAGMLLCGAVLTYVRHVRHEPWLASTPTFALVPTALAIVTLVIAITVVRSRIPQARYDQTSDVYWTPPETRGAVIVLWAVVEGAGLLGVVTYFFTGARAPAVAFLIALFILALFRPARFESVGAA